ncbi:MAG: TRAP transporter TAXI family solute receptor [Natronomonas sp.]|jgi:TRAP transporter TAXI family solute receptor
METPMNNDSVDRRTVLKGTGALAIASLAGCTGDGNGNGGDGSVIEWHAGGEGGTYFPLSNQFKSIVDSETDFSLQVQSTGASVENVGSLDTEAADFALIQNDIAYFARNGESLDAFEGDPVENLRGVATLYPETIHIVVRGDADISSLSDLEGRTVNTGDLGSGTQINALQILESVAGLTTEDFQQQNSGFSDASDQLQNGDIDAAFVVGGWPVGAIENLATNTDIDILNLSESERQAAKEEASWFADDTIPAGTYAGIDEDVNTVSVQAMIATHSGIEADTVEAIGDAIFNNVDDLSIKTDFISRESAQDGMSIELHEGAARLYE